MPSRYSAHLSEIGTTVIEELTERNRDREQALSVSREVIRFSANAIRAVHRGAYDDAVDQLLPIRYRTHRLGGSHAQRDIIAWTLLEAALRAERFKLARALANERTAIKPTSAQNWRYTARALKGLGDDEGAERARAMAASLQV